MNIQLSVLIPVRTTENYDIVERLKFKKKDKSIPNNIEFIVIDDGSDENGALKLKIESINLGYKYIRIDSEDKFFSLARARNIGAKNANGKYLLLEDVDLAPYDGFYSDIIDEIRIWDLDKKQEDFFTIPTIYLTKKGSNEFLENNSRLKAKTLVQKFLEFDTEYFESEAPCSSCVVVSKHHYLSIGGQNESFDRWGFEDHEFANRLLSFSSKLPDPINKTKYIPTKFEDYIKYEGFRARYRLYGDMISLKGIYSFHINHPISCEFRSKQIREGNKKIFEECANKLSTNQYYLGSLEDEVNQERTLLTSTNPYIYNNELWPLLGKVFFYDDGLHSVDEFLKFVEDNAITTVVMQNPYKKEAKIEIYKALQNRGVRCVIAERGALPLSVYFDDTGFCCESTKYDEKYWDRELTQKERQETLEYIKEYKATGASLEKQSSLIGSQAFRKEINISNKQKIIFVPFQTKSDTTVNYFAGKIQSYEKFVETVQEVAEHLPKDWVLCYKNHPLEPSKNDITHGICVDKYHINDILEASSAVLLMNSGCGILAMIYGVPVLHCSKAQYDNKKLNRYISTADEILDFCRNPFAVDKEDCLRFLHYIIFEFYSFADNVYQKRKGKPDSWPVRLIFRKIQYPGKESIYYHRNPQKAIWRRSVLFDRYREYIETTYVELKSKQKIKESPKPIQKEAITEKNKKSIPNTKDKNEKSTDEHKLESKIFNFILNQKLAKKYNTNRDLYFKDSKSILAKIYYLFNK